MEPAQFDAFARSFARTRMSRRRLLWRIVTGAIVATIASLTSFTDLRRGRLDPSGLAQEGPRAGVPPKCGGKTFDPAIQCCIQNTARTLPFIDPTEDWTYCIQREDAGYTPSTNACQAQAGWASEIGIPDSFFTLVDFSEACNNHDRCYGTCNSGQLSCDSQLGLDMAAACGRALATDVALLPACLSQAGLYASALAMLGGAAYEEAQKAACACCRMCTAPLISCNDECVDIRENPNHCGDCSETCIGDQTCCNGQCVNIYVNRSHCGQCNRACETDHVCEGGLCAGKDPGDDAQATDGSCAGVDAWYIAATSGPHVAIPDDDELRQIDAEDLVLIVNRLRSIAADLASMTPPPVARELHEFLVFELLTLGDLFARAAVAIRENNSIALGIARSQINEVEWSLVDVFLDTKSRLEAQCPFPEDVSPSLLSISLMSSDQAGNAHLEAGDDSVYCDDVAPWLFDIQKLIQPLSEIPATPDLQSPADIDLAITHSTAAVYRDIAAGLMAIEPPSAAYIPHITLIRWAEASVGELGELIAAISTGNEERIAQSTGLLLASDGMLVIAFAGLGALEIVCPSAFEEVLEAEETPVETDASPTPPTAIPSPTPAATNTPTPSPSPEPSPTATSAPPPTPTPTPPVEIVLYEADWSAGPNGWTGTPDWHVENGMLISDGTNTSNDLSMVAPYIPDTIADYTIEAEIRLLDGADCGSFGIILRAGDNDNYRVGLEFCASPVWFIGTESNPLVETSAENLPGWHRYRAAIQGNVLAMFVDDAQLLWTQDDRYAGGGFVGLWSKSAEIRVRSFQVIAF